jgi:CHAT domain-containing protein
LPTAAAEGEAVERRLVELGWRVSRLSGEDAAFERVLDGLAQSDWLHYAGHGIVGGRSGWDSGLPLAGEAILDVSAVIGAPRVPAAVVLSACDTAGTANARGAGMQIATAFLIAGARFVIASQGEVRDADAARVSRALYEAAGNGLEGPELLRAAVLALHAAGEPMSTWTGFHAWVR